MHGEQAHIKQHIPIRVAFLGVACVVALLLSGCSAASGSAQHEAGGSLPQWFPDANDMFVEVLVPIQEEALRARLDITHDYRDEFVHGKKSSEYQKYIVLHDTEGESSAANVVRSWDRGNSGVAAHFVVNKDGTVVQCVPLDSIAHHAGFGDTGHNASYGVEDESRDDKKGTTPIGSWASDYGMNSYSVGIELVHVGGSGDYPKAQLDALDALIAYIDAYYGFESTIIDHKAWRSGNSDTSPEFASYLKNYQDHRSYKAQ